MASLQKHEPITPAKQGIGEKPSQERGKSSWITTSKEICSGQAFLFLGYYSAARDIRVGTKTAGFLGKSKGGKEKVMNRLKRRR